MAMILINAMIPIKSGPVCYLLLGVSSHYAQPITGQVTQVTCPVTDQAQPELTPDKRYKTGQGLASDQHWTNTGPFQNNKGYKTAFCPQSAPQITSNAVVQQLAQSNNIEKSLLTICEGNPPVTGGFPSQRASGQATCQVCPCHNPGSWRHCGTHRPVVSAVVWHWQRRLKSEAPAQLVWRMAAWRKLAAYDTDDSSSFR